MRLLSNLSVKMNLDPNHITIPCSSVLLNSFLVWLARSFVGLSVCPLASRSASPSVSLWICWTGPFIWPFIRYNSFRFVSFLVHWVRMWLVYTLECLRSLFPIKEFIICFCASILRKNRTCCSPPRNIPENVSMTWSKKHTLHRHAQLIAIPWYTPLIIILTSSIQKYYSKMLNFFFFNFYSISDRTTTTYFLVFVWAAALNCERLFYASMLLW